MTLDELIERLQTIRAACPAAGYAIIQHPANLSADEIVYERGVVFIRQPPPVKYR